MRIVIAEDDALLQAGLTHLLRAEGMEVTSAVDNPTDLLAAIAADRPDVAVVDVRMPPTFRDEGLRAAVEARRRQPGLAVLVLSAHVEDSYATELLADGAGGVGYLLKERVGKVADFLEALERVAGGGTAMDPEVVAQLLVRRRTDDPLLSLTPREREVLALMAEGHSNATIAGLLVVSDGAVHKHIGNIFSKLGLPTTDGRHRRVLAVLAYLKA
ncbi:response regulator transcription factor [Streptomyces scopuliridis]|uniref:Response regulator transcription factor n=1 Tax=Streptomyces scopuliridis TaxID=452529 RepID=A0ACD4ZK04_9ACTN|nr:response regulator transcription factor [Streptomyces scopuliridis]WSB34584.1 response regulator transcription factor [Streptomyces scopuliridis]WSB98829.1 response regulator transcription factor [Streptomyces scopuliridis]WSC07467.1 response regulator transcription factor [Streptomyces scopuliridis]